MKLFSILLGIHVLLLTAVPSLPMVITTIEAVPCKKSCCQTKEPKAPTNQQNKDCSSGLCNPFMSCCNISALTAQLQKLSIPSEYSNQDFISPIEKPSADFLSDAWHPPKVV